MLPKKVYKQIHRINYVELIVLQVLKVAKLCWALQQKTFEIAGKGRL